MPDRQLGRLFDRSSLGRDNSTRRIFELSDTLTISLRAASNVSGPKEGILDFDLLPEDETDQAYASILHSRADRVEREVILSRILEGRKSLEEVGTPFSRNAKTQYAFLKSKLIAHDTFQQARMGAVFDNHDFVELTMGLTPEMISSADLDAQREIVRILYSDKGISYTRQEIERYRDETKVDEDQVGDLIRVESKQYLQDLADTVGLKFDHPVKISVVKVDDYWIQWASGNVNSFELKYNAHKNHDYKRTQGKIKAMVRHEFWHFYQMFGWLQGIRKGELFPAIGLTSVHDPGQVTSEGMANSIHHFSEAVRGHLDLETEIEIEQEGLRQMVYNNIHILVNENGATDEQMVEYMHQYCPAEPEDEIRRQIASRTKDVTKSTYLMAYGAGFFHQRQYAQALNSEGRKKYLRHLVSSPTNPKQQWDFVMSLRSEQGGKKFAGPLEPFNGNISFPDLDEKINRTGPRHRTYLESTTAQQ